MSRVAIVGAGYVGIGTGVSLAKLGHEVVCLDIDDTRVGAIEKGRAPYFEPGMDRELTALVRRSRIRGSTDTVATVKGAEVVFICVGTPSGQDGSLDSSQVKSACRSIAEGLNHKPRQLIVVKSTVVPGTTESVVIPTLESGSGLHAGDFGICVNPEFLREGRALEDSLNPSHIVIGEYDKSSGNALLRLYSGFSCPKLRTSIRVAEAVKYATNTLLAAKVTFANELANLCTRIGLDADEVIRGLTMDPRISPHHLQPGVGFGGSCFPKDLRALIALSRSNGYEPFLLSTVLSVNDRQHLQATRLLEEELGSLSGKRIALLGLAFKAGTDDVRESKALSVASELILRGARVAGYDPRANANFAKAFQGVDLMDSARAALEGADGCIIQAAWPEFGRLGTKDFAKMAQPVVVDGRRTWPRNRVPKGIRYRRIG